MPEPWSDGAPPRSPRGRTRPSRPALAVGQPPSLRGCRPPPDPRDGSAAPIRGQGGRGRRAGGSPRLPARAGWGGGGDGEMEGS